MRMAQIWDFVCMLTLSVADFIIEIMRLTRSNERTIRATERITWPKGLKRDLMRRQSNTCPYCGARKIMRTMDIDHMTPVVRGGSNDLKNLQVTCKPCNQRKGMMTDQEFRYRYQRLVPSRPLTAPATPVSQAAFRRETKATQQPESVREFRATKFISNRQKITSACLILGGATLVVFLLLWSTWFPNLDGTLLLILSAIPALAFGGGIHIRALFTGMLED